MSDGAVVLLLLFVAAVCWGSGFLAGHAWGWWQCYRDFTPDRPSTERQEPPK